RTIPSRFLDELRGEHVRVSDQADVLASEDAARFIRGAAGGGGGARGEEGWGDAREPELPPGTLGRHPQFGIGTVQSFTGGGSGARVQVKFRDAGLRTLVLEYARLSKVVK